MASVNRVYSALKDIANKDQRGFISPAVFNNFASLAQMNIYNRLFDEASINKRIRNAQADAGRNKSRVKQLNEDLSVFAKRTSLNLSSLDGVRTGDLPSDFAKAISAIVYNGVNPYAPNTQVELIYDEEQINYVLSSTLSAPSADFPVGLITDTGSRRGILVFPGTITQITLTYYKVPKGLNYQGNKVDSQPRWSYTIVAGKEIYDAGNAIDFELPEHYFSELVIEMAKLIGINLRDSDVYTYAKQEEQTQQ